MMTTDRAIQETFARGVSIMVYYHQDGRVKSNRELMIAEIQNLAAHVADLDLKDHEIADRFLLPMQAEMVGRFGPEIGPRLASTFLRAFEGSARVLRNPNAVPLMQSHARARA